MALTVNKIHSERNKFEKKYFNPMRRALKTMLNDVIALYETSIEVDPVKIFEVMDATLLHDTLFKLYVDTGVSFAGWSWDENIDLKEITPIWEDIMNEYAFLKSGLEVVSLKNTQKNTFLNIIDIALNESIEQGLGVEQTARNIRKALRIKGVEQQLWQSRRIVQTEVMASSNYAQIESADNLPFTVRKRWLTGGLSKTERHTLIPGLHGQERDMGEAFDIGGAALMQQPGDPAGGAANVINCKCIVQFFRA